jgi:7-cyano-7-deazaguanine reductase
MNKMAQSPLGKESTYHSQYQPDLLFPLVRKDKRDEIHVPNNLPFKGADIWNAYELSWLNKKGKPVVALGEFIFPCESPNHVESKSFKLYLNSFNNTKFNSFDEVVSTLVKDLSAVTKSVVKVNIIPVDQFADNKIIKLEGINLDHLDIECDTYSVQPDFLKTEDNIVTEVVYSDLLKSNCLVTGQPDWASVQISYTGKKIQHEGLLKYIVSFRNHNEFHEQCVERMFMDITERCAPQKLMVQARYTRRGGLDINPIRSSFDMKTYENGRLCRQ